MVALSALLLSALFLSAVGQSLGLAQELAGDEVQRSLDQVETSTGTQLDEIADIAAFDLEALLQVPVVEAASRRAQSLHEAPAAITVITADELRDMGLTSPAQALSLVPGVDVIPKDERVHLVGMRGFNSLYNNRVLVLLDGRTLTDASPTEAAPFDLLALHPLDLEKIEVLRGPGSTLYGANAFSGVVSLRSKRPLDHPGLEADGQFVLQSLPGFENRGDGQSQRKMGYQAYSAYGWVNPTRTLGARLSVTVGQVPALYEQPESFTDLGAHKVAVRGALDLVSGERTRLAMDLSVAQQEGPMSFSSYRWQPLRREYAASAALSHGEWFVDWLDLEVELDVSEVSAAIPLADLSATPPAEMAPEIRRGHLRTAVRARLPDERGSLTAALEETGESAVYRTIPQDGLIEQTRRFYSAGVLQGELGLDSARTMRVSGGLRAERVDVSSRRSGEITYRNVNWRAGLVWRYADAQDVRVSFATAYRTPTAFQSLVGTRQGPPDEGTEDEDPWVRVGDPEAREWVPRPDLLPEEVRSLEVGYRLSSGRFFRLGATAALQRMEGLIDGALGGGFPGQYLGWQDLTTATAELEVEAHPTAWLRLRGVYAWSQTLDKRLEDVGEVFPSHLGSLGAWGRLGQRWGWHLFANLASGYERTLLVSHPHLWSRPMPKWVSARRGLSGSLHFEAWKRISLSLTGRNVLAHVFDVDDLQIYPQGSGATPIGTTLLVGVRMGGASE